MPPTQGRRTARHTGVSTVGGRGGRRRFLAGTIVGLAAAGLPWLTLACGGDTEREEDDGMGDDRGDDAGTADRVRRYGDDPSQVGDLWLPDGPGPHPVVVLVHGGFWRAAYDRTLMDALAASVVASGWAAWNVEYRRVGQAGGGWPGTFDDVAAAVDHLAALASSPEVSLDLDRVAVAGHSAGGHLAAWVAARPGLPEGAPGAGPAVTVVAAVSQAGVVDLRAAVRDDLGQGATVDLLGAGPDDEPERYDLASPVERVPTGVPTRCAHGRADDLVPIEQSERFVAAALAAGDDAVLAAFEGDHFAVLDPAHESWVETVAWLRPLLGG